jgi:H+/Cl- antiporter ClcA
MGENNIDAFFSEPNPRMDHFRKWLRYLLVVHIVILSFSVVRSKLPSLGRLYYWIDLALDAGVIFCLLMLHKENRLYKLAAGLLIVNIVTDLIGYDYITYHLLFIIRNLELAQYFFQIVSYAGIACALGAIAAEYVAHSRLIQNTDPKLRKWWLWLLAAQLAVSVISSVLGSVLAKLINAGTLSLMTYQNYIYPFLRLAGIVVSVLYMICLHKTERRLAKI